MNIFKASTVLLTGLACILSGAPVNAEKLDPANKTVAATVDSQSITVGDVDEMILSNPQIQPVLSQVTGDEDKIARLRFMVLESLIDRQLMLQAARQSDLVSKSDADEKLQELIAKNGGKEKLQEFLKERNTDYDSFVANMKQDILISEYIDKSVGQDISISEADARAVYDANPEQFAKPAQVHARHILVKAAPDASAEKVEQAKKKIEKLHEQVTEGNASFEEVAKESSECPSAQKGGDLGFFSESQMVKPFAEKAFSMKEGEISEPIKTQFGYHIIKVEGASDAEKAAFEKVEPLIKKQLTSQAKANAAREKIEKLRSAAKIEVSLPKPS